MGEQTLAPIKTSDAARTAMLELGAWAAWLEERVRGFVEARSLLPPPVIYRFSHPVRRALPTTRASIKLWEAYPPACSESGVWEIHVHPRESDARAVIAAALAGMASAIAGPDAKLGRAYGRAAASLGLAPGPNGRKRGGSSWRNTVIDPASRERVEAIADSMGPFPLGALDASKAQRRIRDRNFHKAICPTCGPTNARLSRKTFEERIFMCGGTRMAPHVPVAVTLGQENPRFEAAHNVAQGANLTSLGVCMEVQSGVR